MILNGSCQILYFVLSGLCLLMRKKSWLHIETASANRREDYLNSSSSLSTNAWYLRPPRTVVTHGHDLARRARASYVTTVREVDGRACPKQTSSIQAKNSLYPVSVGLWYTSSDVMCVFFYEGVNWPFLRSGSLFASMLFLVCVFYFSSSLYFWCVNELI